MAGCLVRMPRRGGLPTGRTQGTTSRLLQRQRFLAVRSLAPDHLGVRLVGTLVGRQVRLAFLTHRLELAGQPEELILTDAQLLLVVLQRAFADLLEQVLDPAQAEGNLTAG